MNVVFLDYDGVVNNIVWDSEGKRASYGYPKDNKVNDFQAVQWVSEFCEKFNYSIVVTSTWRNHDNYIECLKNGGLRQGIKVLGKTPNINPYTCRGDEIKAYLKDHPEIENYLIFDDDCDMSELSDHLVKCTGSRGFMLEEYYKAKELHEKFLEDNK